MQKKNNYLWPSLGFVLVILILGIVGESDRQSWQAVEQAYHPKYSIRYTPSRWVRNQAKVGGVVRICGDQVYNRKWKQIGHVRDGQVYDLQGHRKGTL